MKCYRQAIFGLFVYSFASISLGQSYPARPVRLVVSFAAGGGVDLVARLVGQKLSEAWNQQVVIDNRPGAGGNVSAELVAKSPADGCTLYLSSASTGSGSSGHLAMELFRSMAGIELVHVPYKVIGQTTAESIHGMRRTHTWNIHV